jgi:enoyl-CoA hydratase/carnithine racemase
MSSSPPSRSFAPQLPLKFVGGDVSLDFINTVDWTPGGLDNDRLPDYGRLITWARTARVITDAEAQALRLASAHRPAAAQAAYEMARLTRWILHQLFYAVATRQRQLLESTLPEYNQLLSRAYQRLQVSPRGRPAVLAMAGDVRGTRHPALAGGARCGRPAHLS